MPKLLPGLPALRTLAARQGGVITHAQARAHGVGPASVRRRILSGQWVAHLGCIVVSSHPRGQDWRDAWAIGLRHGPTVIVTGPTAARLAGWDISDSLVLAWSADTGNLRTSGLQLLRDTAPRGSRRGPAFRLAHPQDALVDTMLSVPASRALELLDLALQRHWIDGEALSAMSSARAAPGRAGTVRLRRLAAVARSGARSEAEREAAPLLRRLGPHRWRANYPLHDRIGRIVAELDFALPELKICIEIDGRAYHSDADAFERDRARQNALSVDGWMVLRFTWSQLTMRPDWVVETIRRAIALRSSGQPAA